MTVEERFLKKVEKTKTCWFWTGCVVNGYGQLHFKGRKLIRAHRLSYELYKKKIPAGLQIDHLCRNTLCVNPSHLDAVTAKENSRRSYGPQGHNARKTHCHRGHKFSKENTYVRPDGKRNCRICKYKIIQPAPLLNRRRP